MIDNCNNSLTFHNIDHVLFIMQEPVIIGGTPELPELWVSVNGFQIGTPSITMSIAAVMGSYLCSNVQQSKSKSSWWKSLKVS